MSLEFGGCPRDEVGEEREEEEGLGRRDYWKVGTC